MSCETTSKTAINLFKLKCACRANLSTPKFRTLNVASDPTWPGPDIFWTGWLTESISKSDPVCEPPSLHTSDYHHYTAEISVGLHVLILKTIFRHDMHRTNRALSELGSSAKIEKGFITPCGSGLPATHPQLLALIDHSVIITGLKTKR